MYLGPLGLKKLISKTDNVKVRQEKNIETQDRKSLMALISNCIK